MATVLTDFSPTFTLNWNIRFLTDLNLLQTNKHSNTFSINCVLMCDPITYTMNIFKNSALLLFGCNLSTKIIQYHTKHTGMQLLSLSSLLVTKRLSEIQQDSQFQPPQICSLFKKQKADKRPIIYVLSEKINLSWCKLIKHTD